MMMNNLPNENGINLLDLPNKRIQFDGPFFISCALPQSDDLLMHCQSYIDDLFKHRLSLHHFAERWKDNGISLWLAQDVKRSELEQQEKMFAFYMMFSQDIEGYVLVQCQLESQDLLQ
ncbi:TPA: hemophilus-specific protein [Pasteurella multocida]|uniref:Hemophilus-specific protein n=1 Tax=Actinobacillus equuli subsp. equuli TaxID=202947 RepID=A0A9X4G3H2_ACTEU|nr:MULTISPECIES: hemophilus-specific protein [Pasteurellaceae]MDE8035244.1 hemophilus-specific protein [Actinobacillus equuli subsp. equuli]QCA32147.1 hemophilus-specific protein [Pasteurella multocida]QXG51781.1 hemophilus-specific protein [Pasteurella multocida]HDX0990433.1 hemophilus-specific protein [Pasteurella multocida]HDX1015700.1 hemophilus-specific protein [Pasteurella multocida]